ncbi:thiamine phosphate synthase [Parvularcula sp. IMCC14364]|uniref:thiamine phosphate synthase n=1 Tax=Parvularcula sp. IMCC14364 TaxID=3067902 RepID=UPI002740DEBA|nr:thiamine phosphate synthase [Parvularcula sp. IMCC14364]
MVSDLSKSVQPAVRLAHIAARLNAARVNASSRPAPFALALMTDERIPDMVRAIEKLPSVQGSRAAIIFRHYNHPERKKFARHLCALSQQKGHLFLVAGDPALGRDVCADGLHLPGWQLTDALMVRESNPHIILSAACHDEMAIKVATAANVDCLLLSPVFETKSHANKKTLGTDRFKELASSTDIPTLALGGINNYNAEELRDTGAAGIAAISALIPSSELD